MKYLFINGSPNIEGKTAVLAEELFNGYDYETISLVDYRINFYDQEIPGDQFPEILAKVKEADVIALGTPCYWYNMSGAMRTFMDRLYKPSEIHEMHGDLYFIFQGYDVQPWMARDVEKTMESFCEIEGWNYKGMVTSWHEAHLKNLEMK